MTTMLEKAQTAIASYCAPLGISTIREERLAIARAALQAIRGETPFSVRLAGAEAADIRPTEAESVFHAMLTAILEEKPE